MRPRVESRDAREASYWSYTKLASIIGAFAALIAAGGAIVTAYFAWNAFIQARRQADAATKAYVYASSVSDDGTIKNWFLGNSMPLVHIKATLHNFGQGAALIDRAKCALFWGEAARIYSFADVAESPMPYAIASNGQTIVSCISSQPVNGLASGVDLNLSVHDTAAYKTASAKGLYAVILYRYKSAAISDDDTTVKMCFAYNTSTFEFDIRRRDCGQ